MIGTYPGYSIHTILYRFQMNVDIIIVDVSCAISCAISAYNDIKVSDVDVKVWQGSRCPGRDRDSDAGRQLPGNASLSLRLQLELETCNPSHELES